MKRVSFALIVFVSLYTTRGFSIEDQTFCETHPVKCTVICVGTLAIAGVAIRMLLNSSSNSNSDSYSSSYTSRAGSYDPLPTKSIPTTNHRPIDMRLDLNPPLSDFKPDYIELNTKIPEVDLEYFKPDTDLRIVIL